ncbi:MAG: FGGY-family carbohydrate kinase, partial [Armatimonadetes bacterium]|nr:FGGY-family carbohydrate kinase [Armatimonadota bacterium]
DLAFTDLAGREDRFQIEAAEAAKVSPGADGVIFLPSFVPSAGPTKKYGTRGTILGLELATTRGHLIRAALEGLSFQLRQALSILSQATGYEIKAIRVVGGGSKNVFWNRIRADVTGLPVVVTAQKEATVVGAALFALVGAGIYSSIAEAQEAVRAGEEIVEPSAERDIYDELFHKYCSAPPALEAFYETA